MGLNKQKKEKTWCPDQRDVPLNTKGLVRCPTCNKRLSPRAKRDKQGETKGLCLPPHKAK